MFGTLLALLSGGKLGNAAQLFEKAFTAYTQSQSVDADMHKAAVGAAVDIDLPVALEFGIPTRGGKTFVVDQVILRRTK